MKMKTLYQTILKRALCFVLIALLLTATACGSSSGSNTSSSNASDGGSAADAADSSSEDQASPEDSGEEKLAAEQVLNLKYTEVEQIDVNDSHNSNENLVLNEVYEGLFRTFTDEEGVEIITNAGCVDYDVSDDGLTYTFYLREESVWTDGEPVTAQNYYDSWLRVLDPEGTFAAATDILGIAGAEAYYNGEGSAEDVGLEVIDDYTFRVTLASPDAAFLKRINAVPFYPIRKDLIDAADAAGESWATDYTLHVFNGPFIISDRVLENNMTLTKNETYWDADNVTLTQVNLRVIDETSTVAQMMETQQLDVLSLSDLEYIEKWQPLVDDGTLVHQTIAANSVSLLVLDLHEGANGGTSGLLNNEKVRLAMSLALDREEYVDLFKLGLGAPAYGLVPYGLTVGNTEFRAYQPGPLESDEYAALAADPDALRALFEEGCLEEGHSGNAEDETLTTMVYNPSTEQTNTLEWFKQQFESKLGCHVEINICPDLSAEQTARAEYQYDFYTVSWSTGVNDPLTFLEMFITNGGYSFLLGGFSDEEYDSLVSQIRATVDEEERLELCAKAENILITKAGTIPIYYPQTELYYQSYVKNMSGTDEFSRVYILEH